MASSLLVEGIQVLQITRADFASKGSRKCPAKSRGEPGFPHLTIISGCRRPWLGDTMLGIAHSSPDIELRSQRRKNGAEIATNKSGEGQHQNEYRSSPTVRLPLGKGSRTALDGSPNSITHAVCMSRQKISHALLLETCIIINIR